MTYKQQLSTNEWKAKRKEILHRDEYKCQTCLSTKKLEVHHKCYINGHKAWEYDNKNFITLCHTCHSAISEKSTIQVLNKEHVKIKNTTKKLSSKKYITIPHELVNELKSKNIQLIDIYIYGYLKTFMNNRTNKTKKLTIEFISRLSGIIKGTVRAGLERLKDSKYLSFKWVRNTATEYMFNNFKDTEEISQAIIFYKTIEPTEIAFMLVLKQHCKVSKDKFTIPFSIKLGLSEPTTTKYIRMLTTKGFLQKTIKHWK